MNKIRIVPRHRAALLALSLGLLASVSAEADERRVAAAKCVNEAPLLVRREAPDQPRLIVNNGDEVMTGDLLVGGGGAALDSKNGAVRLSFIGDMDGTSPFPIIETAVILHSDSPDADLDFTLDRGRVDLVNRKEKGAARIHVHLRDKVGDVILHEPGARVAIEVYGRWLPGTPFTKEPKPGEGPAMAVVVLALKGDVEIKGPQHEIRLKAPPGPALVMGDGLTEFDPKPEHLEKLPAWAEAGTSERAKQVQAILGKLRALSITKGMGVALDEFLASGDENERRAAVYTIGATDDLPRMAEAMTNAKHPDVWDAGVIALRHWIGRGPGQDQKLYQGLVAQRNYTPAQAATVLNLLHGFSLADVTRPETFEMLIDYLGSDKLAIRGLAGWHLPRLVPAGQKIAYNPLAAKEERDKAVAAWQKLIPSGELPPKAKSDK